MSAAPIRIQLVQAGDIIDFPDDDDGGRFTRIESSLIALGLQRTRTVESPLETLSLLGRGPLVVALYWDGFLTSLRLQTGDAPDFATLFAEMAGSAMFRAGT